MTKQKDQKRLTRARMKKTGESYTAARAVIVGRARGARADTSPQEQWPELAGMSDAKVKAATGRTWAEWVTVLDDAGAHGQSHRDIARHIVSTYEDVNTWWSQTLTVGYERIRGLRSVSQKRDGTWEANKSRTFSVDLLTLYRMFADGRSRKRWLPDGVESIRSAIEGRSIRLDWQGGSQVNLYFVSKGPEKSTVSIQQVRLRSRDEVDGAKAFWQERLDVLGGILHEAR